MKKLLIVIALMPVSGKIFTMPAGSAGKQNAESTKQEAWESFKKFYGGLSLQDKKLALDYLITWKAFASTFDNEIIIASLPDSSDAKKHLGNAYKEISIINSELWNLGSNQKINSIISAFSSALSREKGVQKNVDNPFNRLDTQRAIIEALEYVMQDLKKAISTMKPAGGPAMESAAAE